MGKTSMGQTPGKGPAGVGHSGPRRPKIRLKICTCLGQLQEGGQAPPRGPEDRKGRSGRIEPPGPPCSAATAASLPPWRVCTALPAPLGPSCSRGAREEPTRAPGRRKGQGRCLRPSATGSRFREPRPCRRCERSFLSRARPPGRDPAPTSEGQLSPETHAHSSRQRLPRAVDDAAVAQEDLEELYPPHAARGLGRTGVHCGPRPPAGRLSRERCLGPPRPRPRLGPASASKSVPPQRPRPPVARSVPPQRPRPRAAGRRSGAARGSLAQGAPCWPGGAALSPVRRAGDSAGREGKGRPIASLRASLDGKTSRGRAACWAIGRGPWGRP